MCHKDTMHLHIAFDEEELLVLVVIVQQSWSQSGAPVARLFIGKHHSLHDLDWEITKWSIC